MLRDITLGQIRPSSEISDTNGHLSKAVRAMLLDIVSLFLFQNFIGYLTAAIFLDCVIKLSKVPFSFMVKGMKTILFLLMITVVFNLF